MRVGLLPSSAVRSDQTHTAQRVAVLIPCLNEELTVGAVIADFHRELPDAAIWVVDNGSTDDTIAVGIAAGARIIREPRQGKGFAIRAAFRDIEADVYVLVDGDNQLPAEAVHELIRPVLEGKADMVVGSRSMGGRTSPKAINNLGNIIFSRLLRSALNVRVTDVLSGYRALSRMLVKSLPLASRNFEIEVELTIKTSQRSYRIREVPYQVRPRPPGSTPHLRAGRDGLRISWAILLLFRDYRPMAFFGVAGVLWLLLAASTYWIFGEDGRIWFLPAGVVALLFAIAGLLSFTIGSVLSVLARRFAELEGKVDMVTTVGLGKDPSER
jgi:glycosyltransferase involved in cell wall biosynthesis